ncbi:MAG: hemolysin III family protein [Pseudomonadota bacterium]
MRDEHDISAFRAQRLAAAGLAEGLHAERAHTLDYSPGEKFADGLIHVLGIVSSVVAVTALIVLAAPASDASTLISLSIYGLGMVLVFCCSAAYNMIDVSPYKDWLRRLDHAAIFIKIAATYTPFAVVSVGGAWGAAVLGAVWTIAAVGAPLKLIGGGRFERGGVWLYLLQGWLAIFLAGSLYEALSAPALALMAAGALLYTSGVLFHLWTSLRYHNAIWHGFVLAASFCFYGAIAIGVAFA